MRWPRFLRVYDESGRSVRVEYRYILLMIAAFAFVGIAAIYLPVAMTSTPSFCANCHVMQEPKDLWEDSTHGNVNCIACHVEPGFLKQLEHKVLSYKEIYSQLFKGAEMAADVKRPTNASCLQCHNIDRVVSRAATSRSRIVSTWRCRASSAPTAISTWCIRARGPRAGRRPWTSATCATTASRPRTPAPPAMSSRPTRPRRIPRMPSRTTANWHGSASRIVAGATASSRSSARTATARRRQATKSSRGDTPTGCEVEANGKETCFGCHQEDFCDKCHKVQHPPNWVQTHPEFAQGGGEPCSVCHSPGFLRPLP